MRESPVKTSAVSVLAMMALVCILAIPLNTRAQATSTAVIPDVYIARAVVISIVSNQLSETPGSTQNYNEVVTARILTGVERNKTIEFQASGIVGDGQNLLRGDIVYVTRTTDTDNDPMAAVYTYGAIDHYRLPALAFFAILFLSCIVFIGGKQGLRGLISLAGGMFLIFFILLPGALHGYSPILLSIVIASLIASIGAYITHGVSRMTSSAVVGMVLTILLATMLADLAVHVTYLSGVTDETAYDLLGASGFGSINFQGLLLGGMIIGLLGVLYDAAIGQAVAVEELKRVAPNLPRHTIYGRAFRIGREHIGALVNTLILAYVGTSLPLFLFYYGQPLFSSTYYSPLINQEWFATEMIRMMVGGIGLMLTVPITTLVAVWLLMPKRISSDLGPQPKDSTAESNH